MVTMTDRHDTALLERAGTAPGEPAPRRGRYHPPNRVARTAVAAARPGRVADAVSEPVRADIVDWQGASA